MERAHPELDDGRPAAIAPRGRLLGFVSRGRPETLPKPGLRRGYAARVDKRSHGVLKFPDPNPGGSVSGASIRIATLDDVDAITAIVRSAYRPYSPRIGRDPAPMDADYASLVQA
jgi:hypothetical protein